MYKHGYITDDATNVWLNHKPGYITDGVQPVRLKLGDITDPSVITNNTGNLILAGDC